MSAEKFLTREKLVEYLNQEVEENLESCEVYKLSSYGWLDEWTPNPKYIGYAMYDADSIYMEDWDSIEGYEPVKYRPSDREIFLIKSSEDIFNLMEMSRFSIGLTLLFKHIAEDKPVDPNNYFWLNFINSCLLLSIVSDRIRDFFVLAFFGEKYKNYERKYHKKYGKKIRYSYPFLTAKDIKVNTAITHIIDNLSMLSAKIEIFRRKRNDIVHDIATEFAEKWSKIIINQQNKFDEEKIKGFEREDWEKSIHIAEDSHKSELRDRSKYNIEWYKILVDAINYVLQVENYMRRQIRA